MFISNNKILKPPGFASLWERVLLSPLDCVPRAPYMACTPYDDPLQLCRQRRRSGTDNPETWDPMTSDCVEVPLDLSAASLSAECRTVLEETFKSCFRHTTPSSVSGLVGCIADRSNYQVGTATDSARTIAKMGFRNAASQRAKFGNGIYAAANVTTQSTCTTPQSGASSRENDEDDSKMDLQGLERQFWLGTDCSSASLVLL